MVTNVLHNEMFSVFRSEIPKFCTTFMAFTDFQFQPQHTNSGCELVKVGVKMSSWWPDNSQPDFFKQPLKQDRGKT